MELVFIWTTKRGSWYEQVKCFVRLELAIKFNLFMLSLIRFDFFAAKKV